MPPPRPESPWFSLRDVPVRGPGAIATVWGAGYIHIDPDPSAGGSRRGRRASVRESLTRNQSRSLRLPVRLGWQAPGSLAIMLMMMMISGSVQPGPAGPGSAAADPLRRPHADGRSPMVTTVTTRLQDLAAGPGAAAPPGSLSRAQCQCHGHSGTPPASQARPGGLGLRPGST